MANYGDVALKLGPEWDRDDMHNKQHALMTVGHKDGIADAYLTKAPEDRHQFAWQDKRFRDEVDLRRGEGYRFINKTEWSKNDFLWEWNAEGECVHMGQSLMARAGALFFAAENARENQQMSREDRALAEADQIARQAGIPIMSDGEPRRQSMR